MQFLSAVILGLVLGLGPAMAQETAAENAEMPAPKLEELLWVARPLIVFADNPNDPRFAEQIRMLEEREAELVERDVMILTDVEPKARGPLRAKLHPRGFSLVLVDKDGTIVKRRPQPTSAREIIHLIDRLPSRRQETGSLRPS